MDMRNYGFFDNAILSALHEMMEHSDDIHSSTRGGDKSQSQINQHPASRAYVIDTRAMARTPADVMEYPNAYQFTVDMPGVGPNEVKVQLEENDGVLVVSGERSREKENMDGVNYVRMERRMGKFMRKFALPENANREAISAVCRDGVLTVTVEKLPPPEPKKPKTIEVKVA